MKDSSSQFCTVSRGAEVLCAQWTPLVIRELLCGSKRFGDLHRGVPRMSTSLLAHRLRQLEEYGVVRRSATGKVWEYSLTEAGEELRPIVVSLGHWGARWIGSRIREDQLDGALLLWDIRRSVRLKERPAAPVIIHFQFRDGRPAERLWWLVIEEGAVDLCRGDPGRGSTLVVNSSVRALTEVWMGHKTPQEALQSQAITVTGAKRAAQNQWRWLGESLFAVMRREALRKSAGEKSAVAA